MLGTTSPSGSVTAACKISDAAGDELVVGEPPHLATMIASTQGAARGPIVIARQILLASVAESWFSVSQERTGSGVINAWSAN